MKKKLKELIRQIIDGHREYEKGQSDAMYEELNVFKDPEKAKMYTHEGLRKAILDVLTTYKNEWMKVDKVFNQKVQAVVADAKAEAMKLITTKFKKPADYAAQIANAMKFIEIEGKDITDDVAYMVLKDFVEDHEQMKLFRRYIEKVKNVPSLLNSNGETTFPMTFGQLEDHENILKAIKTLEDGAAAIFLTKKEQRIESFVGGMFEIPTVYLMDSESERKLLFYAEELDRLIADKADDSADPASLEDVMKEYHENQK